MLVDPWQVKKKKQCWVRARHWWCNSQKIALLYCYKIRIIYLGLHNKEGQNIGAIWIKVVLLYIVVDPQSMTIFSHYISLHLYYRHISNFMHKVPFPSSQRPRILVQVSLNWTFTICFLPSIFVYTVCTFLQKWWFYLASQMFKQEHVFVCSTVISTW